MEEVRDRVRVRVLRWRANKKCRTLDVAEVYIYRLRYESHYKQNKLEAEINKDL